MLACTFGVDFNWDAVSGACYDESLKAMIEKEVVHWQFLLRKCRSKF
jgi:hypothetical protein